MLRRDNRSVTSPTVLECRFLGKLFHPDKITNTAAHRHGGGDNTTFPNSPSTADTFTSIPVARDESEKPVVNTCDLLLGRIAARRIRSREPNYARYSRKRTEPRIVKRQMKTRLSKSLVSSRRTTKSILSRTCSSRFRAHVMRERRSGW